MTLKKNKDLIARKRVVQSQPKLSAIKPVPEIIRNLPSTRYYGSKRKLLPWIFENIRLLDFRTVLDGFGGTGSVSLLFKAMGKDVTYHDAFSFNRHVAETVLGNELAEDLLDFNEFVSQVEPNVGVISNNFRGKYYTVDENSWLDGFASKLLSEKLSRSQISLYRYTLFQACLKKRPFNLFHRANLNIRLNEDVTRSFGNKRTWERSFEELMLHSYEELSKTVFKSKSSIDILNSSDITKLEPGFDLLYLDPPYIDALKNTNHDGYWKRYHFLEGLCQYVDWSTLIDQQSTIGALKQPKHFLDWSRKATFKERLFDLIKKHRGSTVVLSYVSDAFPDEVEITNYFEELFPLVSIHSKDHSHALSKMKKRELLFIGRHK